MSVPLIRPASFALLIGLLAGCASHHSSPPVAVPGAAGSARPVHWGYEGSHGPKHWGHLAPVYATCERGTAQSPIDLRSGGAGTPVPLKLNYGSTSLKIAHHEHVIDIVDNGHTIQVTVDEGSTLTTSRAIYHLKQFHFHTPSEHTVDGRHLPMEVHFVHQSPTGEFAVVSGLFVEGAPNENLAKLIANFPKAKGDTAHFPEVSLDLNLQIPASSLAYSYLGSFTTPPCTENVEWFVLEKPVTASREQLRAFAERLDHNNRPVQPRNGRPVGRASVAGSYTR